ncbi:MAG TPA: glycosyltransferase family 2 protein [Segeticoccus sp.]|uniref:glycosyltransferase family 2 protein n=1 Tax=Segeticoccus sp. TaxID=2706531 RepID=UPI002D80311C|nr:glycosyltransferase family 2 protein [Segeticoccus sp.]HET8598966.1 glycosyltransferase family 2 protein [Segeticoccus sp.]
MSIEPAPEALGEQSSVAVVMPILNEERHLEEAVDAILAQDYAGPVEVVLALGPSHDRTDEIAAKLAEKHPQVRTVRNPSGRTPDALNAALAASESDLVVRVDGHGVLDRGYVRTAVELIRSTGAANVGGVMAAEGVTPFERAVAAAMTSRLGVGSAQFHTGGQPGPAETVYLGVFRREWLRRMGGYDPRFVRAQDWELNHRIREAGGLVWFDPRLRVSYRPRGSFRALARQYRDYGRWRRVVARTHSGTINARYLAAPTALLGIVVGAVGGFAAPVLWVLPGGYFALTTVGGLTVRGDLSLRERLLLPAILPTMHLSWGWGFLTSRVRIEGEAPLPEEASFAH